jgi:nucleotide-binding universal stress UspA family protein
MRVLLAIDGSRSSDFARDLVASLHWPTGTIIRVLSVTPLVPSALSALSPFMVASDYAAAADELRARLSDAAGRIEGPRRVVQTQLEHGRPADRIVEEAVGWRAELVVVGSHGRGRVGSLVLGSVSAEVVERIPCPILVARSARVGAVLVATDGSPAARATVQHLTLEGYLAGRRVEVLSISEPHGRSLMPGWSDEFAVCGPGGWTPTRVISETAARAFARQDYPVHASVPEGRPGQEIIQAAVEHGCDLIAMGGDPHAGGILGVHGGRAGRAAGDGGIGVDRPGVGSPGAQRSPRETRARARSHATGHPAGTHAGLDVLTS